MNKYHKEKRISKEEGEALLETGKYEFIGETTCGAVRWNKETGELLYENNVHSNDGFYEFVERVAANQYHIFSGNHYYPEGGMGDYVGSCKTLEEAEEGARAQGDWWYVAFSNEDGSLQEIINSRR